MENPQTLQSYGAFAMFIGALLAILINCLFVWLALVLARLKSTFGGMFFLSAATILPSFLLPSFSFNWLISLALVAVLVPSCTDATSWVDSVKYIVATMIISIALALLILKLVFGTFNINEIIEKSKATTTVGVTESDPETAEPSSAYEAYKDKLTPEELAEIERRVNEPL